MKKPRSRQSYRGRASLVEPRSVEQSENRGRGHKCRGRVSLREIKRSYRVKTAVAVEGAAVAPLFVEKRRNPPGEIPRSRSRMPRSRPSSQDTHRGRGRSAAVAACAFSEISGFPSEDHIFISFLIFS